MGKLTFDTKTAYSPQEVLAEYRQLKRIRARMDWLDWITTPKHELHARQYKKLEVIALTCQQSLYDLIFSGMADEDELHDLIWLGSHSGSLSKGNNSQWWEFMAKIRERQSELPLEIQMHLDWLLSVHGW